ncbi:LuxR family transcriptional regulator [Arthrobacter sp. NPDC093139]|uniref:LuxR family transcriptional regulator n=1 Tax=Arthrobacter sp. NPDC093139 TaxID=3363945 RepID=UPI00382C22E4
MRRLIVLTFAAFAVVAGSLSLAVPSHAATSGSSSTAYIQLEAPENAQAAGTPSPTGESSPSATPSGNPANPGTGEPAESESTRINYAPYFIGGVVLITLIVALVWRRRRGNKTVV